MSYFSNKTYVLGTQKKRRNKTVLLSTTLYIKSDEQENINTLPLKNCVYLDYDVYSMQVLYATVNKSNWFNFKHKR